MNYDVLFTIFLAVMLLMILIFLVRMLLSKRHLAVVAFFAFAMACFLFSTLYCAPNLSFISSFGRQS